MPISELSKSKDWLKIPVRLEYEVKVAWLICTNTELVDFESKITINLSTGKYSSDLWEKTLQANRKIVLIRTTGVLGPFQLNFKSFHSNLKAIHSLNGGLGTGLIVEADEAKAFALIGGSVNEDFRADNITKGKEHLH